ncbi:MAG: hypothetical protein ABIQ30_11350 [Devosia sp.]
MGNHPISVMGAVLRISQIAFLAAAFLLSSAISPIAFAADGAAGPDLIGQTVEVDGTAGRLTSTGGDGTVSGASHDGGDGGQLDVTASTFDDPASILAVGSIGGKSPGPEGDGGDGGSVIYAETADVVSAFLLVASLGGNGQGLSSTGGSGGDIEATIAGSHPTGLPPNFVFGVGVISRAGLGATGGNGGIVDVNFSGETNELYIESSGGDGIILGNGGQINLTLTGDVTGDVILDVKKGSGAAIGGTGGTDGTIEVSLQNGASVGGDIRASQAASAIIELAFKLATDSDVADAYATLQGDAAHGWITVNGEHFEWTGFTELKNHITSLAAQNPTAPIVVTVQPGFTTSAPNAGPETVVGALSQGSAFAPFEDFFHKARPRDPSIHKVGKPTTVRKLVCSTRDVNAFLQTDGSIVINVRVDGARYAAGSIDSDDFTRASGGRWDVTLLDAQTIQIALRDGTVIGTCAIN